MMTGNVTDTSLLVWTTTPWTLPSNQFAAVHPDLEYSMSSIRRRHSEKLIIAARLVETIAAKVEATNCTGQSTCYGTRLVGRTISCRRLTTIYKRISEGATQAI